MVNFQKNFYFATCKLIAGVIFCSIYANCKFQSKFNSPTSLSTALSDTTAYQKKQYNDNLAAINNILSGGRSVSVTQRRDVQNRLSKLFFGNLRGGNYGQLRSYLTSSLNIPFDFFVNYKQIQEIRLAQGFDASKILKPRKYVPNAHVRFKGHQLVNDAVQDTQGRYCLL